MQMVHMANHMSNVACRSGRSLLHSHASYSARAVLPRLVVMTIAAAQQMCKDVL